MCREVQEEKDAKVRQHRKDGLEVRMEQDVQSIRPAECVTRAANNVVRHRIQFGGVYSTFIRHASELWWKGVAGQLRKQRGD
jgi:hypothetical protein